MFKNILKSDLNDQPLQNVSNCFIMKLVSFWDWLCHCFPSNFFLTLKKKRFEIKSIYLWRKVFIFIKFHVFVDNSKNVAPAKSDRNKTTFNPKKANGNINVIQNIGNGDLTKEFPEN